MLKYSIRTLGIVVLCMSVYLTALARGSGIWPQITVSLTIAILLVFTLGTIFWRDGWQSFGVGFAVAGWLYFLLVFVNLIGLRQTLITQTAIDWMYQQIHASKVPSGVRTVYETRTVNGKQVVTVHHVEAPPTPLTTSAPALPTSAPVPAPIPAIAKTYYATPAAPQPGSLTWVDPYSFANIGHALWTLIVGLTCGFVAHYFFMRSGRYTATRTVT